MSTHRIMYGFEQFPAALMRATVQQISVQWGLAAQARFLAEIDNRLYWSGWTGSQFHEAHGRKNTFLYTCREEDRQVMQRELARASIY